MKYKRYWIQPRNRNIFPRDEKGVGNTIEVVDAKALERAVSLLKSAYGFVDAHDNVGLTRVQIKEFLAEVENE